LNDYFLALNTSFDPYPNNLSMFIILPSDPIDCFQHFRELASGQAGQSILPAPVPVTAVELLALDAGGRSLAGF
jgi:hypothetical protein